MTLDPVAVALDPATHRAYVANQGDGTVSVLDTTRNVVVATIRVGNLPGECEGRGGGPGHHRAYVANADGAVSVLGMNGMP